MEEFYFKLKEEEKIPELIGFLIHNRIPHNSYCNDVFSIPKQFLRNLENSGFEFQRAKVINLSDLSLEERNAIKMKSRVYWRENCDKAIDKLLSEYGSSI